jgi:hypothetical protein
MAGKRLDKDKLLDFIQHLHANAAADLRQDHDEWSESAMHITELIMFRITNGDFDDR